MSYIRFDINVEGISEKFGELKNQVTESVQEGAKALASMSHAKVLEIATEELGSLAGKYKEAVSFEEVEPNFWVVSVDLKKAGFMEQGMEGGRFMEWLLNGKSARVSKDGKKYAVIPFEHSKKPSEQSSKAKALTDQIRAELKKRDIPYKKIETNPDGSPRVGLLHTFKGENKISSARPSKMAKYEALHGLSIYQSKDKQTGKVRRDIMTFRIISEKHREEGLWYHPGRPAANIIDKAYQWAVTEWNNTILPNILSKFDEKQR
jgi:hypothetical protein